MDPNPLRRTLATALSGLLLLTASTAWAVSGVTLSGYARDASGKYLSGVLVGVKPDSAPNADNPLADSSQYAVSDTYDHYSVNATANTTYHVAATQITASGGHITGVSLPGAQRVAVMGATSAVQEVRVGPPAPSLGVPGQTATSPHGEAGLALDNDTSTAWQVTADDPAAERTLVLDLGAPTWLTQVLLLWQNTVPASYHLQASNDYDPQSGSGTWQDVYTSTNGRGALLSTLPGIAIGVVVPEKPTQARYLRLSVDALASGQTAAGLAEMLAIPAPPLTGTVTDRDGRPVAGATVGAFLDGGPFTTTDAQGRYTLPLPLGQPVIGAHKEGYALSGPRWLDTRQGNLTADYTLFDAGEDLLPGKPLTATPTGVGGVPAPLTDNDLSTLWVSSRTGSVFLQPTRLTFDMQGATLSEVDVHWKNAPAVWRLELTFDVTNGSGSSPSAQTRTYYSVDTTSTDTARSGGYLASGSTDRRVSAIKFAPVTGVKTMSLVISRAATSDPISAYEVAAYGPNPTPLADAATAMRIAAGFQPAPTDPNATFRFNASNEDSRIDMKDAAELAADVNREVKPLRVLVINYEPYIEAEGGQLLRQITKWKDPHVNTKGHVSDMELASHGYLRVEMLPQIDADEYPVFQDGFRYTDATFLAAYRGAGYRSGSCDYNAIIQEYDLVRRVDSGDVDEVWLQGVPGFQMWETTMAGPNAYWCNSSPVPAPSTSLNGTNGTRLFVLTAFNYERDMDVMIHDWGHRMESIVGNKVYGGYWYGKTNVSSTFDKFARYEYLFPGQASVGNCHYPPNCSLNMTVPQDEIANGKSYDYGNTSTVMSDADDWLNYPNLTGARAPVSRENWHGPRTIGGQPDWQRNYLIWMFERMPHVPGYGPDGKLANWWKYIADPNSYPESR